MMKESTAGAAAETETEEAEAAQIVKVIHHSDITSHLQAILITAMDQTMIKTMTTSASTTRGLDAGRER